MDADAFVILRGDLQARHLHRFIGCREGKVDEASHLLDFFLLDEIQRIEVGDFGRDLAGEGRGIEGCNAADAARAG